MLLFKKILFNLIALIFVIVICYYCFVTDSVRYDKSIWPYKEHAQYGNVSTTLKNITLNETINIWCIFTKVTENAPLQNKFEKMIKSLFIFTSMPLHIHIIKDNTSIVIANRIIEENKHVSKHSISLSFYDVKYCAEQINDIVQTMMPHFSSQPGTYYSDALFYISLGLHLIASKNQERAIMLDCDVQFTKDVSLLYKQFNKFQVNNLFGLSHELTPVYKHVLYLYRHSQNTTFGEFVHSNRLTNSGSHPYGFPGFNSGVMLFNLGAIRQSKLYADIIKKDNVEWLVSKYKFKGHLGDQDFYTILGYEYPELFYNLPCNFNRQLCVWWRDHGYSDIFANYSKCEGDIIIYHGNCNTPIPLL